MPAAISSAPRRPAPARPRRSCCRRCSASRAVGYPRTPRAQWRRLAFRSGAGADARARAAGRRASRSLRRGLSVNTVCIYGGAPYPVQNRDSARGADIIVATPGRLIDHLERGRIDLSTLRGARAGRSRPDARHGLRRRCRAHRRARSEDAPDGAVLRDVRRRDRPALRAPACATPCASISGRIARRRCAIEQRVHFADDHSHKHRILDHLLADIAITQSIVFIATKRDAESLAQRLKGEGHAAAALHGDMNQHERTRTLQRHAARPRAHAGRD